MAAHAESLDVQERADEWLRAFAQAASAASAPELLALLEPDAYWRDALALSWDIHTFYGVDQIREALDSHLAEAKVANLTCSPSCSPHVVTRAGREVIEVLFDFDVAHGLTEARHVVDHRRHARSKSLEKRTGLIELGAVGEDRDRRLSQLLDSRSAFQDDACLSGGVKDANRTHG